MSMIVKGNPDGTVTISTIGTNSKKTTIKFPPISTSGGGVATIIFPPISASGGGVAANIIGTTKTGRNPYRVRNANELIKHLGNLTSTERGVAQDYEVPVDQDIDINQIAESVADNALTAEVRIHLGVKRG